MRLIRSILPLQSEAFWTSTPDIWHTIIKHKHVLGIDGCPDGWAVAARPAPASHAASQEKPAIALAFVSNFSSIMAHRARHKTNLLAAMVDMPIGLRDCGRRQCEIDARKRLGPRKSSVFPAPRRPMLGHATYEEANQWGKDQGTHAGGGLSKQAWNIIPKIREIDENITAEDQSWLNEAHPELAFTRLNTTLPCQFAKKNCQGFAERLKILSAHGINNLDPLLKQTKTGCPYRHVKDDLVDAIALTLTAQGSVDGSAWSLGDGTHDRRGLHMQIWG